MQGDDNLTPTDPAVRSRPWRDCHPTEPALYACPEGRLGKHQLQRFHLREIKLALHEMIQIKSVRIDLEFAKSGLAGEANDLVRMHVFLGGVETLDGLERPGGVLMPFPRLRCHANAAVPKCRERLADGQGFVHGMVQRVKEDGTIELVVE